MEWNYQREETERKIVPEGNHRIRIKSAEKAISRNGNEMLALVFTISGYNQPLFHYITFMKDQPEITNRKLTALFDSFKDIKEGDCNTENWIGKVGACHIKHEEYNGEKTIRLHYFLRAEEQGSLPAWQEPEKKEEAKSAATEPQEIPFTPIAEGEEMPWD